MVLTDVHTHTAFSSDGKSDIYAMNAAAKALGLTYWGISEHIDYDYLVDGIKLPGKAVVYTDEQKYFAAARKLQREEHDMTILVGGELGFSRAPEACRLSAQFIDRYEPDFVVNSVHTQGTCDWYDRNSYVGLSKRDAYIKYLALVRDSLDAPYHYDIVGHIGYPCRFAPYGDKVMHYAEFAAELDDILKTIISKNKILEINSSVKGLDCAFLPFPDIVARYYELGGREVSFASDAHDTGRLMFGRSKAVSALVSVGFDHIAVPCRGKIIKVPIE